MRYAWLIHALFFWDKRWFTFPQSPGLQKTHTHIPPVRFLSHGRNNVNYEESVYPNQYRRIELRPNWPLSFACYKGCGSPALALCTVGLWNIRLASLLEQAKHGTEEPHRTSCANFGTEIELRRHVNLLTR